MPVVVAVPVPVVPVVVAPSAAIPTAVLSVMVTPVAIAMTIPVTAVVRASAITIAMPVGTAIRPAVCATLCPTTIAVALAAAITVSPVAVAIGVGVVAPLSTPFSATICPAFGTAVLPAFDATILPALHTAVSSAIRATLTACDIYLPVNIALAADSSGTIYVPVASLGPLLLAHLPIAVALTYLTALFWPNLRALASLTCFASLAAILACLSLATILPGLASLDPSFRAVSRFGYPGLLALAVGRCCFGSGCASRRYGKDHREGEGARASGCK